MPDTVNEFLLKNLVCPVDKKPLQLRGDCLISSLGREYPVLDGIPLLLVDDQCQTHGASLASLNAITTKHDLHDPYFIKTLGISDSQKSICSLS